MTGKKDSAVTVLPLTDAVLVLLVLALINVAPVFFAAVNLSWPTGQARHAVPSPSRLLKKSAPRDRQIDPVVLRCSQDSGRERHHARRR